MQKKPFLAGAREFAEVYGVTPLRVGQWLDRGSLDRDHAVIVSGSTYWLLDFVRSHGPERRQRLAPDEAVLERLTAEQSPGRWVSQVAEVPPIVGFKEITELFHVSDEKSTAAFARQGRFGEADYRLSGSPLWLLDSIVALAPTLQEQSRSRDWLLDKEVESALRSGEYGGPGSTILTRGPKK